MEPRYRVVFSGRLTPGAELGSVIAAFANRFRVREETARSVLASGRQVLKNDLDLERAERYRAALEQTGLVVELESQDGAAAASAASAPQDERTRTPSPLKRAPDRGASPGPATSGATGAAPGRSQASPGGSAGSTASRLLRERAPEVGATPCPKCGAVAVSPSTGVCQECGVVAERYLERHGAAPGRASGQVDPLAAGHPRNPYAPPRADLTPPRPEGPADRLRDPRGVRVGRGWGWIAEAWPLFRDQPGSWIGAIVILAIVYVVLSLIPLVGTLISSLVGPILTAGLMLGAHAQYGGGRFDVGHLGAGFSHRPGRLALLGAIYLGLAVLMGVTIAAGFALAFMGSGIDLGQGGFDSTGMGPGQLGAMGPLMALPILLAVAVALPVTMALFFAPALVAIEDVPVLRAMKLSFLGCWRNILPFLLFGLAATALMLVALLPLGLGLLIVMPLFTIAVYLSYRDIFY